MSKDLPPRNPNSGTPHSMLKYDSKVKNDFSSSVDAYQLSKPPVKKAYAEDKTCYSS